MHAYDTGVDFGGCATFIRLRKIVSDCEKKNIYFHSFIGKVIDWPGVCNINEGLSLYVVADQPVLLRLNNFFTYIIIGYILYNNHIYTIDV